MPTNLLATDTMYPDLNKGTTDEKIQQIGNYLYMLREQLRYTLGNLGETNFNDSELENIGKIITEPIYLQLYGTEGSTVVQFTEKGLYGRIEDAENNVAQVSANTQALMSRMSNAEGNISTLTQTANSLSSRITSLDGSVSSLTQTVNGFTLSVSNGSTSSTIKLMSGSTTISSQKISFSGTVTFSDLTDSDTVISGSCITTGTIDADEVTIANLRVDELYGNKIYIYDSDYDEGARLSITGASSYEGGKLAIETGAFSVEAADGDVYLENGDGAYIDIIDDEVVVGRASLRPQYDDSFELGTSDRAWQWVYSTNAFQNVSDLAKKDNIEYGLAAFDGFFDDLKPISFVLKSDEARRKHHGLGAQDVEDALIAHGFSMNDFAGVNKTPKKDDEGNNIEGEYTYYLGYSEFIALLIEQVQNLKKRVAALEG